MHVVVKFKNRHILYIYLLFLFIVGSCTMSNSGDPEEDENTIEDVDEDKSDESEMSDNFDQSELSDDFDLSDQSDQSDQSELSDDYDLSELSDEDIVTYQISPNLMSRNYNEIPLEAFRFIYIKPEKK